MDAKLTVTLLFSLLAGTAAAQTIPAYEEHFDGSTLDWTQGSCRLGPEDTCSAPALDSSTYASAPQSLAFSVTRSCNSTEVFSLGTATVDLSLPPGVYQLDAAIRLRYDNVNPDPNAWGQGSLGLFAASNPMGTTSCVTPGGRTCDRGFEHRSGCFGTSGGPTTILAQVAGTGCGASKAWLDDVVITPLPPLEVIFPADITIACGDSTSPWVTGGVSVMGGCHPTVQYFDAGLSTACPGTIQRTWVVSGGAPAVHTQIITIASSDGDNDGVVEPADLCLGTEAGAAVDGDGCSCAQRIELACPAAGPWRNQGAYVSCVSQAASACQEDGLISDQEHGEIVSGAAHR